MTHTTKWIVGVLIVFGFFGLVCVAGVAGFVYYIYKGEGSGEYDAKRAEGREFGKTTDQAACMKEGLARAKGIKLLELNHAISNQAFVAECLKSASPTSGFCDGVPGFWTLKDSEWTNNECKNVGHDSETGCAAVFQAKLDFCQDQK